VDLGCRYMDADDMDLDAKYVLQNSGEKNSFNKSR
jgi:hypothetical protein